MSAARAGIALVNYLVALVNIITWCRSRKSADFWASLAWLASGSFWAWQAICQ